VYFFVLIETSGNQQYIFSTNKLRENVGASEWTWRAGTWFVVDAACEVCGLTPPKQVGWDQRTSAALRTWLLDPAKNTRIDEGSAAEVIIASSGKAYVLVQDKEKAHGIVAHITQRALEEAPGLDVRGVVVEFREGEEPIHEAIQRAHTALEGLRASVPGPSSRFQRLPFVQDCATSGLPAMGWGKEGEDRVPLSAVAVSKREEALQAAALERMKAINGRIQVKNVEELEKRFESADRVAVIHADGNGLGQIFLSFHVHTGTSEASSWRGYSDRLRRFSCALDVCTERAFNAALNAVFPQGSGRKRRRSPVPIIPLVLGGDDLTVLCAGRDAMAFAVAFLRRFEEQTARKLNEPLADVVPLLAETAWGGASLVDLRGDRDRQAALPVLRGLSPGRGAVEVGQGGQDGDVSGRGQARRGGEGGGGVVAGLPCAV